MRDKVARFEQWIEARHQRCVIHPLPLLDPSEADMELSELAVADEDLVDVTIRPIF